MIDHIEIAGRIDRRAFDPEGVFAGWRELPALEQGFGRGRRHREKRNAENREAGSLVHCASMVAQRAGILATN